MKNLIVLESHGAYEEYEVAEDPVVIYDGEHVHYGEYYEPTDTTDIIED